MVLALFIERKKEYGTEAFLVVEAADTAPVDWTARRAAPRRSSDAAELIIVVVIVVC